MANQELNISTRDVIIEEVTLIGSNGRSEDINTGTVFDVIRIYEDIFQHVITGSIQITDGVGLFTRLSLHGNEFIKIKFRVPGEGLGNPDVRFDKVFRIYKCSDKRPLENTQMQRYELFFCSEELIFANQITLSRKLREGGARDHVLSICRKDLKINRKKLYPSHFEVAMGTSDLILTQYKPFEAIEYICSRAYNENESTFLFFENRDGFNFTSIEKMVKREAIINYVYPTAKMTYNPSNAAHTNYNQISKFTYPKVFNTLETTASTAHNGRLLTLDLITQSYKKYDYSHLSAGSRKMLMDTAAPNSPASKLSFPYNNAQNRNGKAIYEEYGTEVNYCLTNKGNGNLDYFRNKTVRSIDTSVERTLLQRKAQLNFLTNSQLECIVPGNPLLTVGRMVEFYLPAFMPQDANNRRIDNYLSGKYLVTRVCHVIAGQTLQTKLTLSKNCLNDNLDNFVDNQNYKDARDF